MPPQPAHGRSQKYYYISRISLLDTSCESCDGSGHRRIARFLDVSDVIVRWVGIGALSVSVARTSATAISVMLPPLISSEEQGVRRVCDRDRDGDSDSRLPIFRAMKWSFSSGLISTGFLAINRSEPGQR